MRFAAILLLALQAGCGGTNGGGPPAADGGQPCVTDTDCPEGGRVDLGNGGLTTTAWLCAYKISDGCSAKGICMQIPSPTCASFIELCGCDGKSVRGGACFYADGYAGGPTTGASYLSCVDGGT
jgi:hypothetical protein